MLSFKIQLNNICNSYFTFTVDFSKNYTLLPPTEGWEVGISVDIWKCYIHLMVKKNEAFNIKYRKNVTKTYVWNDYAGK
jgi:hypothetical protein